MAKRVLTEAQKILARARNRKYAEKHRERLSGRTARQRHKDYEKTLANEAARRKIKKDAIRRNAAKYNRANPEKVRASKLKYSENNPDKIAASARRWAETHKAQKKLYRVRYLNENRDKARTWSRNRRAKRKKAEGTHTEADILN